MRQRLKNICFSLIALAVFFASAEGICRILFVTPGASDFIERSIIQQKLTKFKPKDEFRIFLYGESTMHGDALYPKSTIDKWILIYLEDLLGKEIARKVKIYNFARLGANSHFISKSFTETVGYNPDMAVFYTAHNDFVQLDNRRSDFDVQPLVFGDKEFFDQWFRSCIKKSAFLSEITRLFIRVKIERHKWQDQHKKDDAPAIETWEKFYNPEYDAIDHGSYVFKTIHANWVRNVNKIIHLARRRHIPVVFFEAVCNLKEYQPNESVHRLDLTKAELERWEALNKDAEHAFLDKHYEKATEFYEQCLTIDPEYALTYYRLGQCFESLSQFAKANQNYLLANDKDRVPLRAPSEVNQFYESLRSAALERVTVIPTEKIFEKFSPNGIVDSHLLLDTMHPSIEGQAIASLEIVKAIYKQGLVAPRKLWHWQDLGPTQDYEEKLGLDKDFEFSVYLKKAIFVGRFYEKSIEYSLKALAIKPDSIEAKRQLAWTYWRKGNRKNAFSLYREIYKESPDAVLEVFKKYPELAGSVFSRRRVNRRLPIQLSQAL